MDSCLRLAIRFQFNVNCVWKCRTEIPDIGSALGLMADCYFMGTLIVFGCCTLVKKQGIPDVGASAKRQRTRPIAYFSPKLIQMSLLRTVSISLLQIWSHLVRISDSAGKSETLSNRRLAQ
ncbi:hypothetical protein OE88DRAFT_1384741 [Heliocybe sulcata]|uniref:Uncharacterized protein n=1 Tax=Heliocybe sulcata TaxID=5364 RepID=A0A5C3N602_9AGAM|nr:hypothetical protein OE88DRAFT_1384741 [Heliocybe sulcata]